VENAFKNMKNPFHLAIRPQYHWTDQKIEVHAFICLLAFLMVMVAYKRARERAGFTGSPHTLLEKLSAIKGLQHSLKVRKQNPEAGTRQIICLKIWNQTFSNWQMEWA